MCTSDAKDCTTHVEVMYDCIFSDHHPVLVKVDLNILAEFEQYNSNYLKRHINWDKLPLNVLHDAARDAYLLWKHSGKPRQGVVYDIMKQARSKFKYALRVCKCNRNSIISDKIAESMYAKNDRDFWREIHNYSNSKLRLPNDVTTLVWCGKSTIVTFLIL